MGIGLIHVPIEITVNVEECLHRRQLEIDQVCDQVWERLRGWEWIRLNPDH